MKQKPVISFDHVSVSRGLRRVLTDVSFIIHAGENVVILGPNGSGKSSLIKTITRELYPSNGSISIFGKETWRIFDLRPLLGIVSYDFQALFNQEITGEDAVLSGFFSSVGLWRNNHVTSAMVNKANKIMRWLGIHGLKKRTLTHLSSGEARRFLIARALIHDPKLIVFDEPLNSLDMKAHALIKGTLRKLAKKGVGVVLVTHQLSDIIPEMKRVIMIKNGRIMADGSKEKILTRSNLSKAFDVPAKLIKLASILILCAATAGWAAKKPTPPLTTELVSASAGRLAETVTPTLAPPSYGMPERLRFSFDEDVLPPQPIFLQRQIFIFSVDGYRSLFPKKQQRSFDVRIKFLKDIFRNGQAAFTTKIPIFPISEENEVFKSQTNYVKFGGGMGVRFITRVSHNESPTTNKNIFYTFQGLTHDGAYIVSFFYPITAKNLPISEDSSMAANFIDQLDPDQFSPKLDDLDNIVRSIEFNIPAPTKTPR